MNIKSLLGLFALSILTLGCGKDKVPPRIILDIPVVQALQADVPVIQEFVGQTYGKNEVAIRARVEGFLTGVYFDEGSFVKKGTKLYSIDPDPYQAKVAEAKGKVASARTELALAKSDLDRIEPLAEKNAVSKADLDAARASYKSAQARLEAAQGTLDFAMIELGYCTIMAPFDGWIGKTEAKEGEFVGKYPNPVVLNHVSDIRTIQVRFAIAEVLYLKLARDVAKRKMDEGEDYDARDNKEANRRSRVTLILADGSIYPLKGKFDFLDPYVDPTTGTAMVQVSFDNPKNILLPGQFARVLVEVDKTKGGILIPQRSIKEIQGQFQAFVVSDSNQVEARAIQVGNRMDSLWLVTDGIIPGERVVYDGIQRVSPGMVINPKLVDLKVPKQE